MNCKQKIRIFEAFAGYGSQSLALERLHENFPEFNYEVVGISEIDKYAVQAYNAIHGEVKNFGDVTSMDWNLVPDFDLLTWSSPCQDISNAGKGKGMTEGSGTRSSLLWEVKKPIELKRPKYILFENVKNFIGENNRADARKLFGILGEYGYSVFYKVMNAKDYGVPQNRERIFILAIDGDASYEFPKGFPLERRLKDVLEGNVDERYYLSEKLIKYIFSNGGKKNNIKGGIGVQDGSDSSLCITSNYYKTPRQGNYIIESADTTICINSKVNGKQPSVSGRIYDVRGIMTAITTGFMPKIAEPIPFDDYNQRIPENKDIIGTVTPQFGNQAIRNGWKIIEPFIKQYPRGFNNGFEYKEGYAPTITKSSFEHNNFVVEKKPLEVIGSMQKNAYRGSVDSVSPCITSACGMGGGQTPMISYTDFRIRKLTPRECFRLMDMDDKYIDRIQSAGISNSQQYKLAGNSIVVACLYYIFKNLFIGYEKTTLF